MLFELKSIISRAQEAQASGIKTVLASVVALEGSSYRRPGVRMAVLETGEMVGAVSGGCVEKEVRRQAQAVFADGQPVLMTYDGRYRLGCEGILYILIEPLEISSSFSEAFAKQLQKRIPFRIESSFTLEESGRRLGGSQFYLNGISYACRENFKPSSSLEIFSEDVSPSFRLFIVGAEHDAVTLCSFAANLGWEVHIIAPPDDPKTLDNFPGASQYHGIDENTFKTYDLDSQTAVVLMTHSFVKDVKYLGALVEKPCHYIGLLGPSKRREKLIDTLTEYHPDIDVQWLENLYGPCGLNIGAETPQEIALSILSEILSVYRHQNSISLKDKPTGIHQ